MKKRETLPKGTPQPERRASSDREMLDAAVRLIAAHGTTFTMADVGREAGYSHALAGARFGSRAEFLKQARERLIAKSYAAWQSPSDADGPIESFNKYLQWLEGSSIEARALYVLLTGAIENDSVDREAMAGQNRRLRETFQELIEIATVDGSAEPEFSSHQLSILLVAVLRGLAIQWLLEGSAIDLQELRGAASSMLRAVLGSDDRKAVREPNEDRLATAD